MPELPEVETIARGLRETLPGLVFADVAVYDLRAVPGHEPEEFVRRTRGRTVASVRRRGKLLLLDLEFDAAPQSVLTVHLRMTGRVVHGPDRAPESHERIRFSMNDGSVLTFSDVRRFGGCRVFTPAELERWTFWNVLGPEPLEIGESEFVALFRGRRAKIKGLLLDQRVIAGVGNIYADESLFRAGIRPDAVASGLSAARLKRLRKVLCEVLRQAIAENGSSISDYRNARGDAGAFQNSFQVYGKAGEPCGRCGRTLCGCRVAGRSSTYCDNCQTT
ncbi:bifunctional DNA-formamidopyrimidine glycosylase/DNA-(apurinic or apyrimidinic site) lyase [Paucidesulfovibrio longus]|uniref:bifunctional DNA-formamidopyrimidine glycosylase/DNA-(apurinic or apyrimidinic site) lyase n=1 Tax=Paucidesulfovibrio longus TaxID=889 RepID=UPI0003B3612A|nr:bifunctional DNA-formamidopyrimidine glycosylase/DNA-(apurinic or apyrimidinic site) lyase [Paucidesulfovibrio longus]